MAKRYSDIKSQFITKRMKEGRTNNQARRDWSKSAEKKQCDDDCWKSLVKAKIDNTSNIDRSYESPMSDWAETSEDF